MFYDELKRQCAEKGTTVTSVLDELGMSHNRMTAWRNGEDTPSVATIVKIADQIQGDAGLLCKAAMEGVRNAQDKATSEG